MIYRRLINIDRDKMVMTMLASQYRMGIITRKEAISMFKDYLREKGVL